MKTNATRYFLSAAGVSLLGTAFNAYHAAMGKTECTATAVFFGILFFISLALARFR